MLVIVQLMFHTVFMSKAGHYQGNCVTTDQEHLDNLLLHVLCANVGYSISALQHRLPSVNLPWLEWSFQQEGDVPMRK